MSGVSNNPGHEWEERSAVTQNLNIFLTRYLKERYKHEEKTKLEMIAKTHFGGGIELLERAEKSKKEREVNR